MLPTLETSRLVLSPLDERHLSRFLAVAGERAIADTTVSIPHPLTEAGALDWIRRAAAESASGRAAHFAIAVRPADDDLAGYVAIKAIDRIHEEGELGFMIDARHAGQGYITEAAARVLAFAFDDLRLNRVCAYNMVRNPASGRVLSKLGFQQEGRLRQRVRKWGIYEDVLLWSKLLSDHR